jgi:hypothetical protein
LLGVFLLPGLLAVAQQIPAGTALPVMLNSTLDSTRSKTGDKLEGRLMQDVVLPSGERIKAGSRVLGRVEGSSAPSAGGPATVTMSFERVLSGDREYPISVSLRALASMQDVFEAQLPVGTFDEYGTAISDWTTVQVGGAAVYRGDGTVREALTIVGRATYWGAVTAKLVANLKRGCPTTFEGEQEQALWVFSPWACGAYGFEDTSIGQPQASEPAGRIQLTAARVVHVRGGSGWLLVTLGPPAPAASQGR